MMKTKTTVRKKLSKIEEAAFKEAQLRESDLRKRRSRVRKASTTQHIDDASDEEDSELLLPDVKPKTKAAMKEKSP